MRGKVFSQRELIERHATGISNHKLIGHVEVAGRSARCKRCCANGFRYINRREREDRWVVWVVVAIGISVGWIVGIVGGISYWVPCRVFSARRRLVDQVSVRVGDCSDRIRIDFSNDRYRDELTSFKFTGSRVEQFQVGVTVVRGIQIRCDCAGACGNRRCANESDKRIAKLRGEVFDHRQMIDGGVPCVRQNNFVSHVEVVRCAARCCRKV